MEFLIGGHVAEFRRMLEQIREEIEQLREQIRQLKESLMTD